MTHIAMKVFGSFAFAVILLSQSGLALAEPNPAASRTFLTKSAIPKNS
jgi:hypothetical protein